MFDWVLKTSLLTGVEVFVKHSVLQFSEYLIIFWYIHALILSGFDFVLLFQGDINHKKTGCLLKIFLVED